MVHLTFPVSVQKEVTAQGPRMHIKEISLSLESLFEDGKLFSSALLWRDVFSYFFSNTFVVVVREGGAQHWVRHYPRTELTVEQSPGGKCTLVRICADNKPITSCEDLLSFIRTCVKAEKLYRIKRRIFFLGLLVNMPRIFLSEGHGVRRKTLQELQARKHMLEKVLATLETLLNKKISTQIENEIGAPEPV